MLLVFPPVPWPSGQLGTVGLDGAATVKFASLAAGLALTAADFAVI